MATPVMPKSAPTTPATVRSARENDWAKPAAMAIPKEGYFTPHQGRYGPVYPRTPACHGFTIIAKIRTGREEAIRAYGKTIEKAIENLPDALGVNGAVLVQICMPPPRLGNARLHAIPHCGRWTRSGALVSLCGRSF